jgi:hypothetical protein
MIEIEVPDYDTFTFTSLGAGTYSGSGTIHADGHGFDMAELVAH